MTDIKAKLFLNLILADSEPVEIVKRCLDSVAGQPDDIYITVTYKDQEPTSDSALIKLLTERKVHLSYFKWIDDFAAARNFAMLQVPQSPTNYILWTDADDVVLNPQHLHRIADEAARSQWAAVFFHYFYMVDLDEQGEVREVIVDQQRERIIRHDGTFKWISMLHETLIEQRQENVIKIGRKDCTVIHLTNAERMDKNLERNIRILEKQAEIEQHKDPRTVMYLAKAYFDKGKLALDLADRKINFNMALVLFHDYLEGFGKPGQAGYNEGSGFREERGTAWGYIAEIAILQQAYDVALGALDSAIEEGYEFPNYYIDKAMVYAMKNDFKRAKHWLMLASNIDMPSTTIITTPRDMKLRALEVDFQVSLQEGKLDHALEDVNQLLEILPNNPEFKERQIEVQKLRSSNRAAQSVVYLGKYLEEQSDTDKLGHLVQSIPQNLSDEKFAAEMRHKFLPERVWSDNEIALLCGPGFEVWSPKSLETGLGGSEEAVVYLSQELTKLGWKVTVYANPGKEVGLHNGVDYQPYYNLNTRDSFNVLILWRAIGFVDVKPKAKFIAVWYHDVPNCADITAERLNQVHKLIVLSEYHKSLFKMQKDGKFVDIPERKFFLSANGIPKMEILNNG